MKIFLPLSAKSFEIGLMPFSKKEKKNIRKRVPVHKVDFHIAVKSNARNTVHLIIAKCGKTERFRRRVGAARYTSQKAEKHACHLIFTQEI